MTLLLVDDEFHVRKKLRDKIDWKALGIDLLLEADDGIRGYETALQHKIDILISDVRMPRMSGMEMAEKIRALYPDCVILFLSGYSDKEYLRSAISLHAHSYIDKPVSPLQVAEAGKEAAAEIDDEEEADGGATVLPDAEGSGDSLGHRRRTRHQEDGAEDSQSPQGAAEEVGQREVRYLENPMPLPKKHVKRVLDYGLKSTAEDDDFDFSVAEDDDFDI